MFYSSPFLTPLCVFCRCLCASSDYFHSSAILCEILMRAETDMFSLLMIWVLDMDLPLFRRYYAFPSFLFRFHNRKLCTHETDCRHMEMTSCVVLSKLIFKTSIMSCMLLYRALQLLLNVCSRKRRKKRKTSFFEHRMIASLTTWCESNSASSTC